LALALIVRLAFFAAVRHVAIDNDGTEYVRAAESLRHGAGLVGMRGAPLDIFPPLYSLLIAAIWPIAGNGELAGRLISIVAGAALTIPMFFATKLLFGRMAAILAAVVVALDPYLVGLSIAVLTDQSYVTLLLGGLCFALSAQRRASAGHATLSGSCFGIAYLLRPEALLEGAALAMTLAALTMYRRGLLRAAFAGGAFVLALALFAAPYVAVLSSQHGKPVFEAKTAINYYIGVGLLEGLSYPEAALTIGNDLTAYGRELNDAIPLPEPTLHQQLTFFAKTAPHQAAAIASMLKARGVLTPLGLLLLFVGALRCWRGRSRKELLLLSLALTATAFLALCSVAQFWDRYGTPFVVLAIPWIAKGAVDAYAFAARWKPGLLNAAAGRRAWAIVVLCLAAWCAAALRPDVAAAPTGEPLEKAAGLWLHARDRDPGKIMSSRMIVPYYAGATMAALPFTRSPQTAIRYIARARPRYVELLDTADDESVPYVKSWIARRIPDRRAKLIYSRSESDGSTVQIYRWL